MKDMVIRETIGLMERRRREKRKITWEEEVSIYQFPFIHSLLRHQTRRPATVPALPILQKN